MFIAAVLMLGSLGDALLPQNHQVVFDASRFHTNRDGRALALPAEGESFTFAVYGDRTGGNTGFLSDPSEERSGHDQAQRVLARAVRDTNLAGPDLVMTVGDLIQGYNTTEPWLEQMHEYRETMNGLLCPWFPVAGNHDIYWRGPDRPAEEHEQRYEQHFGPLWYAFDHKGCRFIVLYSDEGNPETGERNFSKPDCQVMSPAQKAWLTQMVTEGASMRHQFVFLHHPRWRKGSYGDDWDQVHKILVSGGNVRAVFAGHIHQATYAGPQDGIEYLSLATVGGGQSFTVPQAGWLHHWNLITVRDDQIQMAMFPVGETMDPRMMTDQNRSEAQRLRDVRPEFLSELPVQEDGSVDAEILVRLANPNPERGVRWHVTLEGDDRWELEPNHRHAQASGNAITEMTFRVRRIPGPVDSRWGTPELVLSSEWMGPGVGIQIPESRHAFPLDIDLGDLPEPDSDQVFKTGVKGAHARVASSALPLPDGPMTLECWVRPDRFSNRVGVVTKTEGSEYGIFASNGRPEFYIHVGGGYRVAAAPEKFRLKTRSWSHLAGVYDGKTVRLFVNGKEVGRSVASGSRLTNALPLVVGGDVAADGTMTSPFEGRLEEVRLSKVARYSQDFSPSERHSSDPETMLLLPCDVAVGSFLPDRSGQKAHAAVTGTVKLSSSDR